jgi:hypothetical protein
MRSRSELWVMLNWTNLRFHKSPRRVAFAVVTAVGLPFPTAAQHPGGLRILEEIERLLTRQEAPLAHSEGRPPEVAHI